LGLFVRTLRAIERNAFIKSAQNVFRIYFPKIGGYAFQSLGAYHKLKILDV
jgi:hypothetical protein